jgi:hypothetical protein
MPALAYLKQRSAGWRRRTFVTPAATIDQVKPGTMWVGGKAIYKLCSAYLTMCEFC